MKKVLGMLVLWIGLCAVTSFLNPDFLQPFNLQNLSRQIALYAILAIGEGIVILSGGIDLSVGSMIAFTGLMVMHGTTVWKLSPWLMCAASLVVCVLVGLVHGFLTTKLKLQAFVVTLSTMLLFRGLCRGLVNDATTGLPSGNESFKQIANGSLIGIPIPVLIMVGLALIWTFYLHLTKHGVYLFAIGRNDKAAAYSGVNVGAMRTISYVICAVMAGIAGILFGVYSNSVQPAAAGQAYELYAIAAAVVGGCSMRGGEGTILGMIIGAAILKTLTNSINLLGIQTVWEFSVIGAVILAGVLADTFYKSRGGKKAKTTRRSRSLNGPGIGAHTQP